MDGTTFVVVLMIVIGMLCALIAIISAAKKQFGLLMIFGIFATAAFLMAWQKPRVDAARDREQRDARREILRRYSEIDKIISLDRVGLEITYTSNQGQSCSTTLVHRNGRWLVNTQTADCK